MNTRMKKFYLTIAEQCATMSRAVRLQVGSVIVKNDNIISFAWNGMPAGWDNNCEHKVWMNQDAGPFLDVEYIEKTWPFEEYSDIDPTVLIGRYALKSNPEVLHAETNALAKLAKSTESGASASMFITHSPCLDCAKLIYQSGISEVFYRTAYRSDSGIIFLKSSGVKVEQLEGG